MHDLTKGESEKIHFKNKLRERWGIVHVNRFEYRELCSQAAHAKPVVRQSARITVRRVEIRGSSILCVFDQFRSRLVTVLPPGVTEAEQVYDYVCRRRSE
jgi:hypothetical protein